MEITITIPDRLAADVEARGFALDAYLRELMESRLSGPSLDREERQKAVDAMLAFAEKHGATLGGLDLKSMVHEGHKY